MLTHQPEPLEITNEVKAKLSAYLNGATFEIDSSGREKFHPRMETVEDDLLVVYMADKTGVDKVDLNVSLRLRSAANNFYDLTDFGLDLVDYSNDQRVTAEWETRTQRVCRALHFGRTYTIVPHGDDGGAEVRDPARSPPPSLKEAEFPPRPRVEAGSGLLTSSRG